MGWTGWLANLGHSMLGKSPYINVVPAGGRTFSRNLHLQLTFSGIRLNKRFELLAQTSYLVLFRKKLAEDANSGKMFYPRLGSELCKGISLT